MVLSAIRFVQSIIHSSQQHGQQRNQHRANDRLIMFALAAIMWGVGQPVNAEPRDLPMMKQTSQSTDDHISQPIVLGVAFEDADELDAAIIRRLNQLDGSYSSLAWDDVSRLRDLENIDVLFLPNIKNVSRRQLHMLTDWLNQGGRLIVSGHFGELSSSTVQAQLRSLLGAYWAFALPEPSQLRVRDRHPLAETMSESSAIAGGVIVATGLENQTLATWQTTHEISVPQGERREGMTRQINVGASGAPAIVATEYATFLGWNWGGSEGYDIESDVAWLQAVLPSGQLAMVETISSRPNTHATSQSGRSSTVGSSARNMQQASDRTSDGGTTQTTARVPAPDLPFLPESDDDFIDPTQQIAPASINVEQNDRPIHILEKFSMTQELESLIGRFESALLASRMHGGESSETISQVDGILVASASNQSGITEELVAQNEGNVPVDAYAQVMNHPALEQAKAVLDAFPDLVNERRYGEARQQWLEARQNLWANFPVDRPIAQPEVRAIWLDRGTIVGAGSRRRLAEIFDQLAIAGINTVFVETVNAGYPIYPSRVAPEQNPMIRNWDPLEAAVELAHERGIEAHAWVWVFAAGNQRHNRIANLPWSYPGPILDAHPEWANVDRRGRSIPVGQDKPFLDPANPQVRRYLAALYEEIVTQYDVDGLHLDYIRYPFQNAASGNSYGYGSASRRQFERQTGVDPLSISPNDRELWQQWTDFRAEQVNSFVADTAESIRGIRPDIVMSAAVFGMSEHERLQKLQQNWEVWAREGDIDMIVIMSYASDTHRFQQLTSPWLLEADLGSTLVVPGIQLFNLSELAAFDQIQSLRDTPAGGYALFAVEHLNDELRTIFNQTQGINEISLAPVPFRDPFTTASERFNALQNEWNFMLDSDALWMRSAQKEELQATSQELQELLNALSENSSIQDIERAQAEFEQFIQQFETWMSLQALTHSYRVQSWQHRLTMIDTLLSYGSDRL